MKVLFIFDRVAHYHIDLFQYLEKELRNAGHELHLLSGQTKVNEKGRVGVNKKIITNQLKYEFKEIRLFSYTFRYQINIIKKISIIGPDIVIAMPHVGNVTIWLLGVLKRKLLFKLYSWECGFEYHENILKKNLTNNFLKLFDYHLAYHNNAKKYLIEHGVNTSKITVFYNTINEQKIKLINKRQAKEKLKYYYPITKNRFIILFVGVILKEKKIDLLIRSFNLLDVNKAVLVIVGDGDYLEELKTNNQNDNIIFTGKIIDEVGLYFDAADVFVLPGTGGLAINEAMAHSLPIISGYADGSADDLVVHGINGFRLKMNSEVELGNYLEKLISEDDLVKEMGQKSREMIITNFSFRNYLNRIISAF